MSLSTPSLKFLLDENVRIELFRYLKQQGFDTELAIKSSPDSKLSLISINEKRILVTNDDDFSKYSAKKIFSVILLKIPQNKPAELISSFEKLVSEMIDFKGKLMVLKLGEWEKLNLES